MAQSEHAPRRDDATPAELAYPIVRAAVSASRFARDEIDFTTAGSADVLEGRPFSFGFALDIAGAVPPIEESHVEGDAAWAAYDAWVRIQAGEADTALVIGWGKSSEGSLAHVFNAMLDPFYEAPLGLDDSAFAALHAAALGTTLTQTPPVTDGACALVMTATPRSPAAWIAGVAHSTDVASIGARSLDDAPSARAALDAAARMAGWSGVDVAELHARFPHEVALLQRVLGSNGSTVNPSGGPLAADPIMATGLVRLGEAALQVLGRAADHQVPNVRRALAHATMGRCLQANMVWLLES